MSCHAIPQLQEIARVVETIAGTVTVNTVIERFQENPALFAVPVETDGLFEGVTSKRELFFRHLSKPFSRDLYARKPIRLLLDSDPLTMPAGWNVHQALEELLRQDPALKNDCFAIMEHGRCSGIVAVSDLMMTISRIQSQLLATLEQLSSRIRREVEMARQIQADLLPFTPMRHAGVTVAAGLVNSTEISGDFYDLFTPDASRLGLLVADVTGHGVQAGLVTTAAKAGLQTLLDNGSSGPGELLCGINRAILATARQQLMMTALIGSVDTADNSLTLASAGHPYPWHYAAASDRWSEVTLDPGFPLGFDDTAGYQECTVPFGAGDKILLFSDGIIEAENREEEPFGAHRFCEVLQDGRRLSPEALKEQLLAAARQFTGSESFVDDVTLLIAEREGMPNDDK